MKIQFLGTAAAEGVPAMFCSCSTCEKTRKLGGKNIRTRSQSLVDDTLLIDLPPDTYLHVLRDGLPIHKIYSCLITHNHLDHLCENELWGRSVGIAKLDEDRPFVLYGTAPAGNMVRPILNRDNLVRDGRVEFKIISPFVPFEAEGYHVTPLAANHDPYTDPVIFLIEKDGKCLLYSNDTGYYSDATWEYLKQHPVHIDLAELDCTQGTEEIHFGHMGLSTVTEVRDRLREMGLIDDRTLCYVNHFSHNGHLTYDEMVPMAEQRGFKTTYDGLTVEF